MYIADQGEFESFLKRAEGSSVLAIDTEFLREKTFYPKLCLLQLATDDEVAIVDPFAISDLGALTPLLRDERTVKLLHAGSQDLDILYRELGVLPTPIFDTQIAAALLGHVQQIGYGSLVSAVCGVSLKKADSLTDWSQRPLSDSQLDYAADDVVYLPELYRRMTTALKEKGRLHWLDDDFADLSSAARYESDPRERYRRLKRVSTLSRRQMSAAREVAAWRELQAEGRNVPRKWILTDEQIVEACRREARTVGELFQVRGIREKLSTRDAREAARALALGLDAPADEWPSPDTGGKSERNVDAQVDLMLALVRLRAKENDVAMPTLASHDDLARVARGHCEGVDVMRGWRRALVGDELLDLLAGRIALRLSGDGLVVDRLGDSD